MKVEPQKEHQWLQQFVGEWTYEHDCDMGPGQPKVKLTGTESVRSIGGVWIVGEGRGNMPDGNEGRMILTLGYDPHKGRFVGSWIGSMMTHLWVYNGWLDDAGRVLTLEAEGPSFTDPTKSQLYRDVYEIKSDKVRTLTAQMRGDDGEWHPFMTATYTRTS